MDQEKFSPEESLRLINTMIHKAKDAYQDTGRGAILWGVVITVCSLVKFAEIQFDFRLPFDIYLLTIVAVIPQVFITIREKKQRKVRPYDEVFMDYLWLAFGVCIFLLSHAINVLAVDWKPVVEEYASLSGHSSSFHLYEYVAPLFLLLYGFPTFVTGASFKFKPMILGGIVCWVFSIITAYTSIKADLLLMAVAAIVAWLIPGIIMEKEYRMYKLKQPV